MSPKRLLLLSALVVLCGRADAAQPTCSSYIDAFATCSHHYAQSEYVFVGRVVAVERVPSPWGPSANRWQKARAVVESSVKGALSGEVEFTVDGSCYGRVIEGSSYMFTAQQSDWPGVQGLLSRHWSQRLDDTPPDELAKLLQEIGEILRGVPQPRLVGTVVESGWHAGSYQAPLPIRPLAGVEVTAEGRDGLRVVARTDEEGRFQFDPLPPDKYAVRAAMPKAGDVRANGQRLGQGGAAEVLINDAVCSYVLQLELAPVGRIAGRIERGRGAWEYSAEVNLYRVERKGGGFARAGGYRVTRSEPAPEGGEPPPLRFAFEEVPAGEYVVAVRNLDPWGRREDFFYPLARDEREAAPVGVEVGRTTELVVKLPSLDERRVFGEVRMPDGTPAEATVGFVTGPEVYGEWHVESLVAVDFAGKATRRAEGGRFEFRHWPGREFRLYAFHETTEGGKPVRFFTQTERLRLDADTGPIILTLERRVWKD